MTTTCTEAKPLPQRLLRTEAIIGLAVSLPFVLIHMLARPDDAPISLSQHFVAAVANFFGPWGVAVVRLVDFPNAGMRAFSWTMAIGLTLAGTALVLLSMRSKRKVLQFLLAGCWALFALIWFTVGLTQIASGLL